MLPSVVARDLDNDPEQLSLAVLPLLRYSEAHSAFARAKSKKDLKGWEGDAFMDAVQENAFALAREEMEAQGGG